MKKKCGKFTENGVKGVLFAMMIPCAFSAVGNHSAAAESSGALDTGSVMTERTDEDGESVYVDGMEVKVVDAGAVEADVVKEVTPHPLTPYQYSEMTVYGGDELQTFTMMGKSYNQGLAYSNYSGSRYAYFNLDQKCNHVSFEAGHIDDSRSGNAVLYIYTDGNLAQTLELSPDMITQEIAVETTGVTQLTFQIDGNDSAYGLANIYGYGYECHNYRREMTRLVSAVADGMYTYTCMDCGYTFDEVIPSQSGCEPYLLPYQSSELYDLASTEDVTDCVYVMGEEIYKGLVFDNYTEYRDALYNLGQAYRTIELTVGHIDNCRGGTVTLRAFADGLQMKEVELTDGMISQQVVLDVTGVTQLKLVFEGKDAAYAAYHIKFVPVTEHGHSFISEVVLEAAVGMTGIRSYTCEYCGATYSEIIPALEG